MKPTMKLLYLIPFIVLFSWSAPIDAQTHSGTPVPSVKGTFPTAQRVPGRPNLVYSPYVKGKMFDIEGFKSGTQIHDPYSGKICISP